MVRSEKKNWPFVQLYIVILVPVIAL